VLLLLVGLVVAVARSVLPGDDDRTLALPPPGEVAAAFVEGEPVFVVHDVGGDVRVLDAVDPHVSEPKVLAYCRDAEAFEDLRHGSRFTRRGAWVGGPAPTGMAAYEIVERDDERVVIAERGDPPSRSDAESDGEVVGPNCVDRLVGVNGEPDPGAVDDLVMHDGPVSEDDVRWYPVTGITELLEELERLGDPDAS
jgi:nitrite reductase/ring-hydroxylating ferredoxin subunit